MKTNSNEDQNSTFDKSFNKSLQYVIFAFIVILILPFIFTQTKFSIFNFSNTGQIGDTIGGIMGPFIAIIAAILTFIAFWAQYKANEKQYEILNHQKEKEVEDNIEKRFFYLIDHYFRLEEQHMQSGYKGKAAYGVSLTELKFIIKMVTQVVTLNFEIDEDELKSKTCYQYAIIKISTELWFDGFDKSNTNENFMSRISTDFINLTETNNNSNHIKFLKKANEYNPEYQYFFTYIHNCTSGQPVHIEDFAIVDFGQGKSFKFSAYFKVIYNILTYVNNIDSSVLNYTKKRNWVKFFIELMSDEELELLAYMGISKVLWGLEFNAKTSLKYQEENVRVQLIDKLIISKYSLFETIFSRINLSEKIRLDDIYFNHTIGRREQEVFEYEKYKKVWVKKDRNQ